MDKTITKYWWARFIIGLVISVVFILLLFHNLDVEKFLVTISRISIPAMLMSLGFLASGYAVRIIRWWLMMRELEPSITKRDCAWPFLVSISINNLLPFRAGDVMRVFGFHKYLRTPAMKIFGTLVVERLLDLMLLLCIFFICLISVPEGGISSAFVNMAIGVAAVGATMVFTLLLFTKQLNCVFQWVLGLRVFRGRGFTAHLVRYADHLFNTFDILGARRLSIQLIALSFLIWGFEGAVFVSVAYGLDIGSSLIGPYFSLATGTLATLLPSSPGYFGTFDYFASYGMEIFGVDRELATVFALAVHFILWLPLTLTGIMYYLSLGFHAGNRKRVKNNPKEGDLKL